MFEAEKEDRQIIKHSKEIDEHWSVFDKTIAKLVITIKEGKHVKMQAEEREKE